MRKLLRSLATLLALRAANAAVDAANLALGPGRADVDRGVPPGGFDRPELESGQVVMATEEVVPLLPRPSLDGLEAACRERMALVVRHGPARGFDSGRVRAALLAQCDAAFDLYLLAASAFDDNEELAP